MLPCSSLAQATEFQRALLPSLTQWSQPMSCLLGSAGMSFKKTTYTKVLVERDLVSNGFHCVSSDQGCVVMLTVNGLKLHIAEVLQIPLVIPAANCLKRHHRWPAIGGHFKITHQAGETGSSTGLLRLRNHTFCSALSQMRGSEHSK